MLQCIHRNRRIDHSASGDPRVALTSSCLALAESSEDICEDAAEDTLPDVTYKQRIRNSGLLLTTQGIQLTGKFL